jgi:hypothetical protein
MIEQLRRVFSPISKDLKFGVVFCKSGSYSNQLSQNPDRNGTIDVPNPCGG